MTIVMRCEQHKKTSLEKDSFLNPFCHSEALAEESQEKEIFRYRSR